MASLSTTPGLPSWSSESYLANACIARDVSVDGPAAALLSFIQNPNQCRVDGGSLVNQYFVLAIALVVFNLVMVAYFLPRAGDLDPINFDGEVVHEKNNAGASPMVLGENDYEIEYVEGPPPVGAMMMGPERESSDE